jgi:DNA modification methylase
MADRIEMWPLGRLIPYDRNSRTHTDEQVQQIAASILKFGFTQPILVDQNDGILAGHGRLKAARLLGLAEAPVIPLDHLTEEERRAYIIADNKLAENAGWDEEMLRGELEALEEAGFDLELTGFSERELAELLDDSGDAIQGETDADEAPPLSDPVSRPGDLWLLGKHRVLCGDATDPGAAARLMGTDRAQLVLTDPPYNVDYRGGPNLERKEIEGDKLDAGAFTKLLDAAFANYRAYLRPDASLYIFYALSSQQAFVDAAENAGFHIRCHVLWIKNHLVLSFNRYKQAHEAILYCHLRGEVDAWYGDNTQSTVWAEPKPIANREHPTAKPVDLLQRPIVNSTRRGEIVMDFFGGSGSTLVACDRLGRIARLIEIDPAYVDVTLRRWANFTRQQPILESSGSTFLQIERERLLLERPIKPEGRLKKRKPRTAAAS